MYLVDKKTGQEFEIKQIKAGELLSGDYIVLLTEHSLKPESVIRIRETFKKYFPNVKAFILEEGMKLAILKNRTDNQDLDIETLEIKNYET